MMPPYHLAHLRPDQLAAIEDLENDLGLTLIAWEQGPTDQASDPAFHAMDDSILDAIGDSYQSDGLMPYPDLLGP